MTTVLKTSIHLKNIKMLTTETKLSPNPVMSVALAVLAIHNKV